MLKATVGLVLTIIVVALTAVVGLAIRLGCGYWLHVRRLVLNLANCQCPHCGETIGCRAAKCAYRDWDRAPAISATAIGGHIFDGLPDPFWPLLCTSCGQSGWFDMRDEMVYRSRSVGNVKLYAITDAMNEADLDGELAPERIAVICAASGCDQTEVLQVWHGLWRAGENYAKPSENVGAGTGR